MESQSHGALHKAYSYVCLICQRWIPWSKVWFLCEGFFFCWQRGELLYKAKGGLCGLDGKYGSVAGPEI